MIVNEILYRYKGNEENIVIPDGVKNISNCAFENCCSIRNIIIPDSVINIGMLAFAGCKNLERITIPDSIKYIERAVFGNCENLTSITLPASIESIHNDAFCNCVNLTYLTISVNNNKIKVNLSHKGNMNTIKTLQNILSLVRDKDFSVRLDLKIKYKLIMDYFFATGDNVAECYIKKNSLKFIKFVIENFSVNDLYFFLNKNIFVTKRNIDKLIDHAVQHGKTDIAETLSGYKITMKW